MIRILVVIFLALAVLPDAGSAASREDGQPVVTVPANSAPWVDSGMTVERGKRYRIVAEGRWRIGPTCNETDASGAGVFTLICWDVIPIKFLPKVSPAALLAKIGPAGQPFETGSLLEFDAEADGRLYYHINDKGTTFDNTGSVDVTVRRVSPGGQASSSPPSPPPVRPDPAQESYSAPQDSPAQLPQEISPRPTSGKQRPGERRQALVIGNANYQGIPLANPGNDARDLGTALNRLGFRTEVLIDADRRTMVEAIRAFGARAGDGVALFFFSGHGIQVHGENFLVPIGADIRSEADVEHEAVAAGRVLSALGEVDTRLNIVILDACRNNPFSRKFRSQSRGLASIDAPRGTIIAFATAPGDVARDGTGRNSPYTTAILRNLNAPGRSVEMFFKEVGREVDRTTEGQQRPWMSSDFLGDFSFAKP